MRPRHRPPGRRSLRRRHAPDEAPRRLRLQLRRSRRALRRRVARPLRPNLPRRATSPGISGTTACPAIRRWPASCSTASASTPPCGSPTSCSGSRAAASTRRRSSISSTAGMTCCSTASSTSRGSGAAGRSCCRAPSWRSSIRRGWSGAGGWIIGCAATAHLDRGSPTSRPIPSSPGTTSSGSPVRSGRWG